MNGNSQTITLSYTSLPIFQGFFNENFPLLTAVTYPDGSAYHFSYEPSTFYPGTYTGRLASMTVPTGGVISYSYTDASGYGGVSTSYYLQQVKRTTSDGTTTYAISSINYGSYPEAEGPVEETSTTTVTSPDSTSIHSFVAGYQGGLYEISSSTYQGSSTSGSPLESTTHCYASGTSGTCTIQPFSIALPITQVSETRSLNGSPASRTTTTYTNLNLPSEIDVYDYGASVPIRKTITTFASLGNYITSKPSSVIVENGNGTNVSKTTYGYDETALVASSATNLGLVSGARGNLTSQHVWLNTSNATLDSHWTYDQAGQIASDEDARGNTTYYHYDQASDSCLNETIYPPLSSGTTITTSQVCDPNTNVITSAIDANGVTTAYSYDAMLHRIGTTVSGGGSTAAATTSTFSGSSLPETVTKTVSASPSPSEATTTVFDGYGRISSATGANGALVGTTYDGLGRVNCVTNPELPSSPQPTDGKTCTFYDALDRVTQTTLPDGTSTTATYQGATATSYDEDGNQTGRTYDALGRLVAVVEPNQATTQSDMMQPIIC